MPRNTPTNQTLTFRTGLSAALLGALLGCGSDGVSGVSQVNSAPIVQSDSPIPRVYTDPASVTTLQDGSQLYLVHRFRDGVQEGFAQLYPADGTEPTDFAVFGHEDSSQLDLELDVQNETGLHPAYHLSGGRLQGADLLQVHLAPGQEPGSEPDQVLDFHAVAPGSPDRISSRQIAAKVARPPLIYYARNMREVTLEYHNELPVLDPPERAWFVPEVQRMAKRTEPHLVELYYCWWPGQSWAWYDLWDYGLKRTGHIHFVNGQLSSANWTQKRSSRPNAHGLFDSPFDPSTWKSPATGPDLELVWP